MNIPISLNTILVALKLKDATPLEEGVTNGYAPYEELDAKRTTKLGMAFVIIMVVAGIWQGQVLLGSIEETIRPPESLSACFSDAVNRSGLPIRINRSSSLYYENRGSYGSTACYYSALEVKRGFPALYDSIKPKIEKLSIVNTELSIAYSNLSKEKNNKNTQQQNYNTSLFENISGKDQTVYSSSSIATTLVLAEDGIMVLEKLIATQQLEVQSIQNEIKQTIVRSSSLLEFVASDYDSAIRLVELKRFLISFLILTPLVWFTMRRYFAAKNTRSPYSIIWGGSALISAILFGQVLIVLVYKIIPESLLEKTTQLLSELFQSFEFLVIVLQWLGFVLIPLFFGCLVYKIQKKFYNPLAVAVRSIKEGKCPKCTMKIKDSMIHCPMCSFGLRVQCQSCPSTSVCFARYCEGCGKSISEQILAV
jgi:hypothetical protein